MYALRKHRYNYVKNKIISQEMIEKNKKLENLQKEKNKLHEIRQKMINYWRKELIN